MLILKLYQCPCHEPFQKLEQSINYRTCNTKLCLFTFEAVVCYIHFFFDIVLYAVSRVMPTVTRLTYVHCDLDGGITLICQAQHNGCEGLIRQVTLSSLAQTWRKLIGDSYLQWCDRQRRWVAATGTATHLFLLETDGLETCKCTSDSFWTPFCLHIRHGERFRQRTNRHSADVLSRTHLV